MKFSKRNVQRLYAAHKAHGYYVDQGRGVLIRRFMSENSNNPMVAWARTNLPAAAHTTWHRNDYFTVEQLRESGAPAALIDLALGYDPERESVVAIEYKRGHISDLEIVQLDGEPLPIN